MNTLPSSALRKVEPLRTLREIIDHAKKNCPPRNDNRQWGWQPVAERGFVLVQHYADGTWRIILDNNKSPLRRGIGEGDDIEIALTIALLNLMHQS